MFSVLALNTCDDGHHDCRHPNKHHHANHDDEEPLLYYQWLFNGVPIEGATFGSLTLTDTKLVDAGAYSVAVFNGAGSVLSSYATLEVLVPAVIVAQPQSQNVDLGLPVTFTVVATSPSTITYQWLKNGQIIPGANGDTYTIGAVTEADSGYYSVLITDPIATIESDQAQLEVLVDPEFAPVDLSIPVVQGGTATLQCGGAGGFAPVELSLAPWVHFLRAARGREVHNQLLYLPFDKLIQQAMQDPAAPRAAPPAVPEVPAPAEATRSRDRRCAAVTAKRAEENR